MPTLVPLVTLLSAYSHTNPTHISLEIYSPLYLTVAPRIQIVPICHLSGLRDSKAKSAEVWNGRILTMIKQFRLSELLHPLKIRTPATSYPLAEELNTWIIIITLSSALKMHRLFSAYENPDNPIPGRDLQMLVTSSSCHDGTSHWLSAEVLVPRILSASGFSVPVLTDATAVDLSGSSPPSRSPHQKDKTFYTSIFLNLPGSPKGEHEVVLTDWRADEHCNIVLHRQHSQFLLQTLIWSKVALLAIYFSWSHCKRVLISVLYLTSICCPEENQGQINDFQRQDSFFSSRFRKWFCLDE